MTATPASLKAELPEFASVPDASVQKWLDRAAKMLNPDAWQSIYDDGQIFLAAHYMASMGVLPGAVVSAGAMKSKTVGPVSVTYETAPTTSERDADLDRTKYGRLFKQLRGTLPLSPMVL